MNLKNIFSKSAAIFIAISLLLSNCSLFGVGLSKVIAEDAQAPKVELNIENKKYVQYRKDENNSGVAIQSKVTISSNQEKNTYMPTKNVELEITLPKINGYFPERVSVVKANTQATTGEIENERVNQEYNKNSGLLNISYENIENSQGEIYSKYKENIKDEFEIIYIYPSQAYIGNDENVNLQYTLNGKVTFKKDAQEIVSESTKRIELTEKENKEDITTFKVTELKKPIYKGFLYSNEKNGTNYDTDYKYVSTLCVLNNQVVNELTMEMQENKFIILENNEKTEVPTSGKMIYKATGISKKEFDKILGQDGVIEFYNGDQLIATVKYIEVRENNKTIKRLATVYSEDNVRILSDEDTAAIVEYPENLKSVKIKTSKPIAEGMLNFENQNIIKAASDYGCKVEEIKYVRNTCKINNIKANMNMTLTEPTEKISVTASNKNFSTLQTSKTTLTIKLDDTNESTKLFDNPTLKITLPVGLKGTLSSPEILNGNGLKIKSTNVSNNIITISLKGKQTTYDVNNVSGGVSIVMDIENINFKNTTPSRTDKIVVDCIQNEQTVAQASCNVNIVSKEGLLILNNLKTLDSSVTVMDREIKEINLNNSNSIKNATQTIDFVNNYDKDLENVQIIGTLGYTNENLVSKFITSIKKLEVNGQNNIEIYYTEKENANYNDESWTKELNKNVKSYKIVLKDNKIPAKSNLKINSIVEIPENLSSNNQSYINVKINYKYNGVSNEQSSTVGFNTGKDTSSETPTKDPTNQNMEINTNLTAGGKVINNGDEVYEGQIIRCKVILKNNTNQEISNIKLKTSIKNAVYYEIVDTGESYNINDSPCSRYMEADENDLLREKQVTIPANSSVEYVYSYVVKKDVDNVINEINIIDKNGNTINETKNENNVKAAKIKLLFTYPYNEENLVKNTMNAILYIQNYDNKDLKDVIVNINLSNELNPEEYNYYGNNNVDLTYDKERNLIQLHIDKIAAKQTENILVVYNVNIDYDKKSTTVWLNASCEYDGETYLSNDFYKTAYQIKSNLNINVSNNVNKQYIEKGDKVTYTVNVTNSGTIDLNNSLVGVEPASGLTLESAYIIDANNHKERLNINDLSNISINIDIKQSDNITIIYNFIVEETSEIMKSEFKVVDSKLNVVSKESILNGKVENVIGNNNGNDINNDTNNNNNTENINSDNSTENNNTDNQQGTLYEISGIAWLDNNKNGQKDEDEKLMDSVIVTLINKETGNIVTDESGNAIKTTTNSNGEYKFENLKQGTYLVLFEFDTNTYTVTTYQKSGVEQNLNSDAILTTTTINGEQKLAGITDTIEIKTANISNIDIGLIENPNFDLSLDKQITAVTVINSQGTQEFNYKNGHTAKVDLVAKYINSASVVVNYKFTITNNGDTVGYVDSLVDSLPSGLEFSSELNKEWYKGSDGKLYTTSLSGIAIEPGETSEIELVLTKDMTENSTGVFTNTASLEKISNLENVSEKDKALENNNSSADLIISIKTGSAILYIGITLACVAVIAVGAYIVKKKILNREI